MKRKPRHSTAAKLLHGALIGLASALAALALWGGGLFDSWEAVTFDIRARFLARGRPAADHHRSPAAVASLTVSSENL